MPPVVGTNSWVTIAEANTYFTNKYGASAWAGLSDTVKTQLLITAYRWMKALPDVSIPDSSTSTTVKNAQCEVAWYIYNFYADHEKRQALHTQGVRSFTLSKFSETLDAPSFPQWIKDMLGDFISGGNNAFPRVQRNLS